jgi:Ca-activated chloride channel homolog
MSDHNQREVHMSVRAVSAVFRASSLFTLLVSMASLSQTQTTFQADSIKGPVCVVWDSLTGATVSLSPARAVYNVTISDGFAHIKLTQQYINNIGPIKDIVYVFPLPDNGSVHAMAMQYRDSLYRAKIYERQQAQQMYDSVMAHGGTAALLVQDRPNIFQQRLANIAAGETAWVQIEVAMPLKYNNGQYELAIPTMIGERYQSEGQAPVPSSGKLWNPPADVPGDMLEINIMAQTGFETGPLTSPTHVIDEATLETIRRHFETRQLIPVGATCEAAFCRCATLHSVTTINNRDFVLRFKRISERSDVTVASHKDSTYGTGHFALSIFPDDTLFSGQRLVMDVVLLIDVSGSQGGWPLQKEKEIALGVLAKLQPTDRLTVLSFSDYTYWAFGDANPRLATAENIATASNYINGLVTLGGTNLLDGVTAALNVPNTAERPRYYIFMTDGFITNETAILDTIRNHASHPTVFTFGAGDNLNRYFLEQCAAIGNGYATEITQLEDVAPKVTDAWNKIDSPQLQNMTVTFSGATVHDLIMPLGTTLYRGLPVTLFGCYDQGGVVNVSVSGTRAGQPIILSKTVAFANGWNTNHMLPAVWAKQKIDQLSIAEGTTSVNKDSIIAVSVRYQVLSKYTAFLAISPQPVNDDNSISIPMTETSYFSTQTARHALAGFSVVWIAGRLVVSVPEEELIAEILICDLKGAVLFRFKPGTAARISRFLWDGRLANGLLRTGKYVVMVRTASGRTFSTAFNWHQ